MEPKKLSAKMLSRANDISWYLMTERKQYNAVHLARYLGLKNPTSNSTAATIRQLVHYLRVEKDARICSNDDGYFWSEEPADLRACVDWLRGKVATTLSAAAALERQAERIEEKMIENGEDQGELSFT